MHIAHDDVIKWKHFPRNWPFVRGIHRSPVNSPHKGQWRGALMFTLICARINGWVNNREAGDLRRHCAHYDVIVMCNPVIQKTLCGGPGWCTLPPLGTPRRDSRIPWHHCTLLASARNMMTSSNGNIFRVTGHLCGEFTGEFPSQGPVTRSFDVLFDLRLRKRLSKQSRRRRFETPSSSLRRHCNDYSHRSG